MSETQTDPDQTRPMLVGGDGGRPRVVRLWLGRRRTIAGLAVLVILAAAALYFGMFAPQTSLAEKKAVSASQAEAKGFGEKSQGYTLTQLNNAAYLAYDGRCPEARAVYDDAIKTLNGMKQSDVDAFDKRIEDLCSGKTPRPAPQNLD